MQKIVILFLGIFLFYFFSAQPSYAARSISLTANKSALFGNEEVVLTASISGFTNGETIYIKCAFYQEGSMNYFGLTKNGDNWIKNGESTTSQKQIKIGDWDGALTIKSDFTDSGYMGEGSYKLKVGFYYLTSTGNLSSVNWSVNTIDINISEPDPTPLPTPTLTFTPIPTPIKSPTVLLSPTKASITKTPTPSKKPSKKVDKNVLGATSSNSNGDSSSEKELPVRDFTKKDQNENNMGALVFIAGAIFLIACAILIYLKMKNRKQEL